MRNYLLWQQKPGKIETHLIDKLMKGFIAYFYSK